MTVSVAKDVELPDLSKLTRHEVLDNADGTRVFIPNIEDESALKEELRNLLNKGEFAMIILEADYAIVRILKDANALLDEIRKLEGSVNFFSTKGFVDMYKG